MHTKNYTRMLLTCGFLLLTGSSLWANQTDVGIESSFKNSYVFSNYLKSDDIVLHSQDGIVTLTGTVADENHKSLAENTVQNLPNVKSVNNELQVKQLLPAAYSDAWIGLKVKSALLFHRHVNAVWTQVDVKDGIVTLSGNAESEAQKELTAEYARDVDGVKEVNNNMVVKKSDKNPSETMSSEIDDASITAQIKLSLLEHRSTSAIRTHVQTENGVVTLTGTAKNDAEKALVTKLVSDINGVKNVINHMDVQS